MPPSRVLDDCPDFDGWVSPEDLRIGQAFYSSCNDRASAGRIPHENPIYIFDRTVPEDNEEGEAYIMGLVLVEGTIIETINVCIKARMRSTMWHYVKKP